MSQRRRYLCTHRSGERDIHTNVGASELLSNKESLRYASVKRKNVTADDKWISEVISSGTLSDKVAALALKVTASPLHHIETLDILIAMVVKNSGPLSWRSMHSKISSYITFYLRGN
jgi:hypothetical protein